MKHVLPASLLCMYGLLFATDCRCEPGWSGNRCHVREKPSLTTSSPTLESTQLGNKEIHLLTTAALDILIHIIIDYKSTHVFCCLDSVYAGIGIGLVLLLAGVAVCFLALCKRKCGLMWVQMALFRHMRQCFLWIRWLLCLFGPQKRWPNEIWHDG